MVQAEGPARASVLRWRAGRESERQEMLEMEPKKGGVALGVSAGTTL